MRKVKGAIRPGIGWLVLLAGLIPVPSEAQERGRWAVGISRAISVVSAGSVGPSEAGVEIAWAPFRPSLWGLGAEYGRNGPRVRATVRYGTAGLGARGESLDPEEASNRALIVTEGVYEVFTAAVSVSSRLVRLRGGPVLRPALGAGLESWTALGESSHTLAVLHGGLALEIGIAGPFVAALEAEVGYSPASPFRREDMPDNYRLRSTWRRTVAAAGYLRF